MLCCAVLQAVRHRNHNLGAALLSIRAGSGQRSQAVVSKARRRPEGLQSEVSALHMVELCFLENYCTDKYISPTSGTCILNHSNAFYKMVTHLYIGCDATGKHDGT